MSTLEKFKNQKTAYLLKAIGYVPEYKDICEVDIVSVGRKYVTIANNAKFAEPEHEHKENYLEEWVNCGWPRYLFAAKRDALDYVEKRQIVAWFGKSGNLLNDMSLESLRRVKSIIENDLKTEKKSIVKAENPDFWDMCHRGDIVFPSVVQRYFGVTKQTAIEMCERQISDRKCIAVYFVKCPECQELSRKYYNREDIPDHYTCENGCEECEDIPVSDDMIVKYYEWQ
jgi:hypothetical protein